jgi:hypothetical protein
VQGVTGEWVEILTKPDVKEIREQLLVTEFSMKFLSYRPCTIKEFAVLLFLCYILIPSATTKYLWEK